ncbi:hypothetical protein RU95_GL003707 [Enterococcus avium]|nr:hypothetical protein RU95_GL003707 [Enterococcus avium]
MLLFFIWELFMSTLFVFFFHKGALVEVQKRNFAYFLMRVVR